MIVAYSFARSIELSSEARFSSHSPKLRPAMAFYLNIEDSIFRTDCDGMLYKKKLHDIMCVKDVWIH